MDAFGAIKGRRTIRAYSGKAVSDRIVKKILEAGIWAPSPHNSQPWSYRIFTGADRRRDLVEAISSHSKEILPSIRPLFMKSLDVMKSAPVIVLVYNERSLSRRLVYLGEPYVSASRLSETQGVASSIQNMLIMARSLGLGSAWLNMPLLAYKEIRRVTGDGRNLEALVTFGYPAEKGAVLKRRALEDVVEFAG